MLVFIQSFVRCRKHEYGLNFFNMLLLFFYAVLTQAAGAIIASQEAKRDAEEKIAGA